MAKDKYDQFMYLSVTQSSANTLTFGQLALGMNLFDYAGLIVSKIDYYLSVLSIAELVANADTIALALSGSDSITALDLSKAEVYDMMELQVAISGTPATAQIVKQPWTHDFSTMEGGGMLLPAQNLYIGVSSAGSAIAIAASMRVYFRIVKLTAQDFVELVQRLRVMST